MNEIFNYTAAHAGWLLAFVPFLCVLVYFAIQSRWDAYSRRKAYEELKLLNELREKRILTQEEFDEKKEELHVSGIASKLRMLRPGSAP